MALEALDNGFALVLDGTTILEHRADAPCLFVGRGEAEVHGARGHFEIADYVVERITLRHAEISGDTVRLAPHDGAPWALALRITTQDGNAEIAFDALDPTINRLWLRTPAEAGEHVWGAASSSPISTCAAAISRSGPPSPASAATSPLCSPGWPIRSAAGATISTPTIRSRPGSPRAATPARRDHGLCRFRFPSPRLPRDRGLGSAGADRAVGTGRISSSWSAALSSRFGRQPPLPDWVLPARSSASSRATRASSGWKAYEDAGVAISGLWCEDWVGLRITSSATGCSGTGSGTRRYPGLPARSPSWPSAASASWAM
jgi:alpha-glucosidase